MFGVKLKSIAKYRSENYTSLLWCIIFMFQMLLTIKHVVYRQMKVISHHLFRPYENIFVYLPKLIYFKIKFLSFFLHHIYSNNFPDAFSWCSIYNETSTQNQELINCIFVGLYDEDPKCISLHVWTMQKN